MRRLETMVGVSHTVTADTIFPRVVELRRQFHKYPELAYQEVNTAQTHHA